MKNTIRTTLAALLAVSGASSAHAQSAGCTALDGFAAGTVAVRVTETLTALPLDEGEVITLTATSVTSSQPVGTPVWAFADNAIGGFGTGAISPTFPSSTTAISETLTVPAGGLPSGLALTEFGPWFTDLLGVSISCGTGTSLLGTASQLSAGNQHQSIHETLDRN